MQIDAIWQPESQQKIFRCLMDAMSRPGKVADLSEWSNGQGAARGVLATLMDAEVSLADHHGLLDTTDWPLFQAEQHSAEQADYILCNGARAPDFEPRLGTLACPDQSATLVIQLQSLLAGDQQLRLSGPGIETATSLSVSGLDRAWITAREEWTGAFPLGIDYLLCDSQRVVGIPRTTQLEVLSWAM